MTKSDNLKSVIRSVSQAIDLLNCLSDIDKTGAFDHVYASLAHGLLTLARDMLSSSYSISDIVRPALESGTKNHPDKSGPSQLTLDDLFRDTASNTQTDEDPRIEDPRIEDPRIEDPFIEEKTRFRSETGQAEKTIADLDDDLEALSDDSLMPVHDAARYLAVSQASVYNMITLNRLEHVRIGKSIRIKKSALDSFIKGHTKPIISKAKTKLPGAALTIQQVAKKLSVSPSSVYNYVREGRLSIVTGPGEPMAVSEQDLGLFLKSHARK